MAKNYTKDLIRPEFIRLLDKKPLHNVTITGLTRQCKIKRGTFYHHHENLTELIKETFDEELDQVIEEYNETLSWEEGFILATKLILDNKKAIKHMYESDCKIDLERYVFSISGEIMNKCVSRQTETTRAQETDVKLIAYFYQYALSSALIQWVTTDMRTDPKAVTRGMGELMDGDILLSLKRNEGLKKFIQKIGLE